MAKAFSWSYSKLKNYVTCPKRHYEVDLAKNYTEDTAQLKWGNEVHNSLAKAILHKAHLPAVGSGRDRVEPAPLPESMEDYQKWVDAVGVLKAGEKLHVECKYAVTKNFQPTGWFDGNVWYRAIADVLSINGNVAAMLDWKTGKVQHDSKQLMIAGQAMLAHHPQVDTIKTRFVWLKDDCTTFEKFERATIHKEWPSVLATVKEMENAAATMNYPPIPGRLCNSYCPVSSCPFHGKRHS